MLAHWIGDWFPSVGVSIVAGALGGYLSSWMTDARRKRESRKQKGDIRARLLGDMPALLAEIQHDLTDPESKDLRRMMILPSPDTTVWLDGSWLIYYTKTHPEVINHFITLENLGLVGDISDSDTPKYQFTEEFVEMVRSIKPTVNA